MKISGDTLKHLWNFKKNLGKIYLHVGKFQKILGLRNIWPKMLRKFKIFSFFSYFTWNLYRFYKKFAFTTPQLPMFFNLLNWSYFLKSSNVFQKYFFKLFPKISIIFNQNSLVLTFNNLQSSAKLFKILMKFTWNFC